MLHQKDLHNNGRFRFPFGQITCGHQYILKLEKAQAPFPQMALPHDDA